MSINSRPQRDDDQQTGSDFLEPSHRAEDTAKLQCWIPAELHQWLKAKAVEGRTNMTVLLIQALENYRRERG